VSDGASKRVSEDKHVAGPVGLRTRLKAGAEDAYEAAHAAIWPEVQAAQREAGIRTWTTFRDGLDLFHVVDCDDFARAEAVLATNPVDQQWQAEMAKYVDRSHDDGVGTAHRLSLIYHGDNHA
jgi:L-rhamnose mutarotase